MRSIKCCIKVVALQVTAFYMLLSVVVTVHAAAYRPKSDNEVIDTLPVGSSTFETRLNTKKFGKQSFSVVQPRISELLAQAYSQGDPRALGQAESLLEPYESDNTPEIMMIKATILQANHRFDESKSKIQAILKKIPNQPDAILMLSSINLVQGNFDAARKNCDGIRDVGMMVIRFVCMAQVDDMTGKIASSRDVLFKLTQINNGLTLEQLRWLNLILADIALRLNDPVLAASVLKQLDSSSAPSLTAKADWLLQQQDWKAAQHLLASHTDNDALLLRLVMSELHLKSPQAPADLRLLGERIKIWQQRGDQAHQREEAMYTLLINQPKAALDLARSNWQKQRETADVVIYCNAAIQAHSVTDMKIIQQWIHQTGFEYPRLTQALAHAIQAG